MDLNTTNQIETAGPVAAAERIKTIDIVRGVALLGILLMNIEGFIDWSIRDAIIRGPHDTVDFRIMAVINTFFEDTMFGLFAMLFGAGMILFTMNKKETFRGVTVAELYYRRLLLLVMFGVINSYVLLWNGDILYTYGLAGMLLYPFRKTAAKWLFLLGILCIGIYMFKGQLRYNETREKRAAYHVTVKTEKAGKKLTSEQQQAKITWLEIENGQRPDPESIDRHIRIMRSDYGTIFNYRIPGNSYGDSLGIYHGIWNPLWLMFIGMALFRLGFFSNKLSTSSYAMALIIGYGIGIALGWVMFSKSLLRSFNYGAYVDAHRVPHAALNDFRKLFLCIGHASLIILVFRSRIIPWLMKGLANVGQMAFTNYLMQTIICTLFFYGYGLGYYNYLKYHQLFYVVGAVWIFQLIFSAIWLRYYLFGPFEWLWRSATYWKRQPMMKR